MTRLSNPSITCVIPAYNEADNLREFLPKLWRKLQTFSSKVELMVIDDGSTDDTAHVLNEMRAALPLSYLRLSRNFGKEAALSAGIDTADGDIVILIDADGQHPLATLDVFMTEWRNGFDMVYGVRANRDDESQLKQRGTALFYRLLNASSSIEIHENAGDFRLLSQDVVHALRQLPERSRMMKGLYAWVGFNTKAVTFEVQTRAGGASQFRFRQLSSLALTGLTSFSTVLLRVWVVIGLAISLFALLYGGYIMIKSLILGADVPGWPTIVVGMFFLGGIQLLSIGILGEYLARVFTEVKARPLYLVRESYRTAEKKHNEG